MVSDSQEPQWKRIGRISFIVIGLAAAARLVLMPFDVGTRTEPQTQEEFRAAVKDVFAQERKNWEEAWLASGQPPPPEGFDAYWKKSMAAAHGQPLPEEEVGLPPPDGPGETVPVAESGVP